VLICSLLSGQLLYVMLEATERGYPKSDLLFTTGVDGFVDAHDHGPCSN
jgi:hypothetical protein